MLGRGLAPLLVAGLLVVGCSDDGGEDVTSAEPGSTGTSSPGDTCADLEASVVKVVEDPGPADSRSEGDAPPPEEVAAYEAAAPALERLAADGPEVLRADAAVLAEIFAVPYDELTQEQGEAVYEPADRLIAWGAEECDLGGPVWRCAERATFRTVGAPIDAGPGLGFASPEAVVDTADADPAWERVEVERTDERVTYAWIAADGLAVRSETAAVVDDGSWTTDQTTTCDAGIDLGDEGPLVDPPLDPDDLPPPSSTSVS